MQACTNLTPDARKAGASFPWFTRIAPDRMAPETEFVRPSRLALALLLATTAAPPAAARPLPRASADGAIRFDVSRFTLPNGLTVLVHSNRRNPNVFVGVFYRVGAKDEPRGRSGFTHLFEHLMFQPTANRGGDYLTPLLAAGARDANASTLADYTEYHQTVPTNALDLALWLESDRMAHLAGGLTQAVLDEQRAVVKNEARQTPPAESLSDQRFQRDFYGPGHPYSHPVIGTMEDIDAATLAEVKEWYRTYYGAGNAILVLSGDIDVATARAKVARYFADVPRGPVPPRIAAVRPQPTQISRVTFAHRVATPVIARIWSIDPTAARDLTLLGMVEQTMKVPGPGSLTTALVGEGKPASAVTVSMDQQQLATTFSLSITLRPGVPVSVGDAALDAALAHYLAQGPDQRRLSAIATATDQALLRRMQGNASVGMQMGLGELYLGDPATLLRQRDWTAGATPEQVRAVARRWLSRPYYQQTIVPGEPQPLPLLAPAPAPPPPLTEAPPPVRPDTAGTVDRTQMPQPGAFKDTVRFPRLTRTVLANGLTLIVAERHDLPLVDAYLQFPVGTLADDRYAPGTVRQAFDLMTAGTAGLDTAALSARREATGLITGGSRGARTSSFSWSTLSRNAAAGFALAADMLRRPSYPQAQVDASNRAAAASRAALADTPQAAAPAALMNALWGDHPAGLLIGPDTARALTRNDLIAFHDRELGADGATLVMMGDITPAAAQALAERHFGDWRRAAPPPASADAPAAPAAPRVILIDAPGATQSLVTLGTLVAPYAADTRPAEVIADMTLASSFDSRLNATLRGEKGWTYGFEGGIADAPAGRRLFSASGAIETAHTADAMAEIRRTLGELVTTRPITAAELAARRTAAIRTVPLSLDSDAAIIQSIVRANDRGRPLDDATRAAGRFDVVTLAQVNQAARATYRPDAMTWVVVGDLARIEAGIRALNLAPVEVRDIWGRRLR